MMTETTASVFAKRRPPIVIAEESLEPLSDVAESLLDVLPEVGHFLEDELTRARLVPLRAMPRDVVTMNATVEFTLGQSDRVERRRLVFPADCVAGGGCISIASPAGVALLGLREGQTMSWTSRHGELLSLRVLRVHPPTDN
jgi:regulator of nucleoside diphosphate kinase